jgi:hypothetical protein
MRMWTLWTAMLLAVVSLTPRLTADDGKVDAKAKLIQAAGVHRFDQFRELRFTFNVARKDQPTVSRSFVWTPATQEVQVRAVDKDGKPFALSYQRDQIKEHTPADIVQADKWFINDSYWLLMPLHLSWSGDVQIEEKGLATKPIGGGEALLVVVSYPPTAGGYTPGDAYDLYVNPSSWLVEQWAFRRGGAAEPTLVNTFDDYHMLGPLRLAFEHKNADGSFRLWFSDVSAVTKDGKTIKPKATKVMQKRGE